MSTKDQFIVLTGIVLSAFLALCLMVLLIYGGYLFASWLTGKPRVHHVDCSVAEFSPDYPPAIRQQCQLIRSGAKVL